MFGIGGRGSDLGLLAVASFADGAVPYSARLVLRDAARAPEPFLNIIKASSDGRIPLSARMPPAFAHPRLLPPGARGRRQDPAARRRRVRRRLPLSRRRLGCAGAPGPQGGGGRGVPVFLRPAGAHGLCGGWRLRRRTRLPRRRLSAEWIERDHLRAGARMRRLRGDVRFSHAAREDGRSPPSRRPAGSRCSSPRRAARRRRAPATGQDRCPGPAG